MTITTQTAPTATRTAPISLERLEEIKAELTRLIAADPEIKIPEKRREFTLQMLSDIDQSLRGDALSLLNEVSSDPRNKSRWDTLALVIMRAIDERQKLGK